MYKNLPNGLPVNNFLKYVKHHVKELVPICPVPISPASCAARFSLPLCAASSQHCEGALDLHCVVVLA